MNTSPTTRLATTAGLSFAAFAARRASIRDIGAAGAARSTTGSGRHAAAPLGRPPPLGPPAGGRRAGAGGGVGPGLRLGRNAADDLGGGLWGPRDDGGEDFGARFGGEVLGRDLDPLLGRRSSRGRLLGPVPVALVPGGVVPLVRGSLGLLRPLVGCVAGPRLRYASERGLRYGFPCSGVRSGPRTGKRSGSVRSGPVRSRSARDVVRPEPRRGVPAGQRIVERIREAVHRRHERAVGPVRPSRVRAPGPASGPRRPAVTRRPCPPQARAPPTARRPPGLRTVPASWRASGGRAR